MRNSSKNDNSKSNPTQKKGVENKNNKGTNNSYKVMKGLKESWKKFDEISKVFIVIFSIFGLVSFAMSYGTDEILDNKFDVVEDINKLFKKIDEGFLDVSEEREKQLLLFYNSVPEKLGDSIQDPPFDTIPSKNEKILIDTLTSRINTLISVMNREERLLKKILDKDSSYFNSTIEKLSIHSKISLPGSNILGYYKEFNEIYLDGKIYTSLENRKEKIYTRIIIIWVSILFICFAGIAFIFIGNSINQLIGKEVKLDKKKDKANYFLAGALLVWVVMNYLSLYEIYHFNDIDNEATIKIIKSILSTVNSFLLLRAIFDFDYKTDPWWKKKKLYKKTLGTVFGNIVLVGIVLSFQVFTILVVEKNRADEYVNYFDFSLSVIVALLLWFHLSSAFRERNKPEFNILVGVTLFLAIYYHSFFFFSDDRILFDISSKFILGILYQILLISLFLFLDFSWVDFFKGISLSEEIEIVKDLRMNMHHRMKNYLGRISMYATSFSMDGKVKENPLAYSVTKQLLTRISIYQELTEIIYNTERESDEIVNETSIEKFISKLCVRYKKLYNKNNFIEEIDFEGLDEGNELIDVKAAQYLGETITELVLNVLKSAEDERKAWIKLEVKNIFGKYLYVVASDKNNSFPFEEKIKAGQRGGLKTINDQMVKWEGKIRYYRSEEKNKIELSIPFFHLVAKK